MICEHSSMSKLLFLYSCIVLSSYSSLSAHISKSLPEPDAIIPANRIQRDKKPWTFIVYVAADNNLRDFASRNLKQMASIGSNNYINILVHLDIRLIGSKKTTRRYLIEKNKISQIDLAHEKTPMNSGDPETLISACKWAIENYPAEHYALILWNHGTGIIDPYGRRLLNTDSLFYYNASTQKYELDRTIGFLDLIAALNSDPKGICWDDSHNDFMTNQKLEYALHEITQKTLGGKRFDIIGFDACLMSMLEVAEIIKRYARLQVSSQEVELGPGWEYFNVLIPFSTASMDPHTFAAHIVRAFEKSYGTITNDYTQSALDLDLVPLLEQNISALGEVFLNALHSNHSAVYKSIIATSRNKNACTHFNEPSYIDLSHLYSNLLANLRLAPQNEPFSVQARALLEDGQNLIKQIVIANVVGSNLAKAQGISIYFPERRLHPSYKKSTFATSNKWSTFLTSYLLS